MAEHGSPSHGASSQTDSSHDISSEMRARPPSQAEDEQPAESGFVPSDSFTAVHSGEEPPPSDPKPRWLRRHGGRDAGGGEASLEDQPTESGVLPEERLSAVRAAEGLCCQIIA